MRPELEKKVQQAIRLLQMTAPADGSPVEVAYSGGKDSDVILQLAKEAGINYRAIYKNTTIDPPGTIKHCNDNGVEVLQPKLSFLKLIEQRGFPSRQRRFCCQVLKEYKVLDKAIIGVRKAESVKRNKRYQEPTECRIFGKDQHVEQIYPILTWTDEDVVEFIKDRGLQIHPLYYKEDGTIDPKRRLGCIGCPQAYFKQRIEAYKKHPVLVRQMIRAGRKFMETHPDAVICKNYRDEYEYFYRNLFCNSQDEWNMKSDGLFGKPDCKAFLENYFKISLDAPAHQG